MASTFYTTTATSDSTTDCSTDSIWYSWTVATTTGNTVRIWNSWVQGTATTTSITYNTNTIWSGWINQLGVGHQIYVPPIETPEQVAARAARDAAYREVRLRETKAARRAERLLHRYLSEEQKKQLDEKGEFEVVSESGKLYAIKKGCAGNVYSLDEHRRKIASHCIHPIDNVPDHDAMLAQMIWLKWNEKEFLKKANTSNMRAA